MTRDEHMAWCKRRALAYLPGNPREAITSMISDLGEHDETKGLGETVGMIAMFELANATPNSARRFIEGFN